MFSELINLHSSMNRLPIKNLSLLVCLILFWHTNVKAQLCQGSLGAPIVNITFGSGLNPGPALPTATTNYMYVANDCPNDGFYTLRGNTNNCFNSSWHTLSSDHTGDAGGYCMLVNASVQPGVFYTDTVKGLCAGTTFEFAAWVANILRSSACGGNGTKPNLTFSIEKTDGSIIQQYSTGDINQTANLQWVQYGFFFTTPVGITDVVLRIINNAPGGCGNDIALDDITFRPCGPLVATSIANSGGNNALVCQGQRADFNLSCNISAGYSNPVFQWQSSFNGAPFVNINGATASTYALTMPAQTLPGTYTYRVIASDAVNLNNPSCRVISSTITITVDPFQVSAISSNSPVCANDDLHLSVTSNATHYQWSGPNGFNASTASIVLPKVLSNSSGKYYLLASTANCSNYDSIAITINPLPTASINLSNATICEGDTVQLIANGGVQYEWLPPTSITAPANAVTKIFPSISTHYTVSVKNNFDCIDTVGASITVIKKAMGNAGPDLFTIVGYPIRLQALAGGDQINYTWSPSIYLDSPYILRPLVNAPAGEYRYRLTVISAVGCGFAPDEVKVTVYNKLHIPSAFTPNNDGKNDRWIIAALPVFPMAEVTVYNRYGEIILKEKSSFKGWDGTYKGQPTPAGIYIYTIKLEAQQYLPVFKGTLTLIR